MARPVRPKQLNVRLTDEMLRRIDDAVKRSRVLTRSDIVRILISRALEAQLDKLSERSVHAA